MEQQKDEFVDWYRIHNLVEMGDWQELSEEAAAISDAYVLQRIIKILSERLAQPE